MCQNFLTKIFIQILLKFQFRDGLVQTVSMYFCTFPMRQRYIGIFKESHKPGVLYVMSQN